MKSFYKILLAIIAIAYLISPIDLIPDFMIPYIGWLDDAFIVGLIFYYLKYNRLPSFLSGFGKSDQNKKNHYDRSNNYYNDNYFSNNRQKQDRNGNDSTKGKEKSGYWYKSKSDTSNQYQNMNRNQNKRKTYEHGAGSKTYNEDTGGGKSKKTPYDILGVDINATKEEIHTAYRKLVKQYHPDRVAHLGKEFQELANKKFIEIKDAYNTLMK